MVLLKPACGSSSNLKCLENVSYHSTHWAPKVKEMPILTGAQLSYRKKTPINDENYTIQAWCTNPCIHLT